MSSLGQYDHLVHGWYLDRCRALQEALTPNVTSYIQRASELLFMEAEVFALELDVKEQTLDQRCVLAKCALKCALRSCESRCRHLPRSVDASSAKGLLQFTERVRAALVELEESAQYQATPMVLSPRGRRLRYRRLPLETPPGTAAHDRCCSPR